MNGSTGTQSGAIAVFTASGRTHGHDITIVGNTCRVIEDCFCFITLARADKCTIVGNVFEADSGLAANYPFEIIADRSTVADNIFDCGSNAGGIFVNEGHGNRITGNHITGLAGASAGITIYAQAVGQLTRATTSLPTTPLNYPPRRTRTPFVWFRTPRARVIWTGR